MANNNKKKINIGFDIGVTSVGWSIIDENSKILDMGVRLFDDPANAKNGTLGNVKRRSSRCSRRRTNRTRTRKQIFIEFLVKHHWIENEDEIVDLINIDITEFNVNNPIELRIRALNDKISKEQLIFLLFNYIHHRGFLYVTDEMMKPEFLEKQNEFPSIKIHEFYKANGYYKGADMNANISADSYANEIRAILNKQLIDENFTNEYLDIFKLHRDFATGPGSAKSPTKYGLYRIENNELVCKGENLWDCTIGKCTYLKDENRGLKNSPIAIVFNLLNDLNNLYLFNNSELKIDKNVKEELFKEISKKLSKSVTLNSIKKIHNNIYTENKIDDTDIFGYRINTKNKPEFTDLSNYCEIIKWMKCNKLIDEDINLFDIIIINKANDLFENLAKYQDVLKRLKYLNSEYSHCDSESNKLLCTSLSGLTKTHSLSYKVMIDFIQNCLFENVNQMQYFSQKYGQQGNDKFKNHKYIPRGLYDEEIISPTARRAFNQNVKVMNKIIKFYSDEYDINNITFEMARDKNTAEQAKKIKANQAKNKEEIELILKNNDRNDMGIKSKDKLKLKLWNEQNGIDLYDGKPITFEQVLNGNEVDVDHIIPYSISNMDGRNNKVLTKSYLNKEKGDSTPYQWLQSIGKYEEYKDRVLKNIINNKSKLDNLLYENDPLTDLTGFIDRNLTDTRYACRVVLNTFQDFFKQNKDKYPFTKIKVINGAITNYARYNLFNIPKYREFYEHHAIDAAIVNYLGTNNNINKFLTHTNEDEKSILRDRKRFEKNKDTRTIVDHFTGEIINLFDTFKFNDKIKTLKDQIIDFSSNNKIKFSRQLAQKNNIQLSNETIYAFKWKSENSGYIINKIKLIDKDTKIADLDVYFHKEKIVTKKLEKLIIYNEDKKLYDLLFDIYNRYYDGELNPFINFMRVEHGVGKPKFLQFDNFRIIALRVIGDEKNISNIIALKEKNLNAKNQKPKAILETLYALLVKIYVDKNGKFHLIPINQKCLKYNKGKLTIDDNKLNAILKSKGIDCKSPCFDITNGTIFINKETKQLFYSNGGGDYNANKLEIKALFADNLAIIKGTFVLPRKQYNVSISTIAKEYFLAQVDELGKVYNIQDLMI